MKLFKTLLTILFVSLLSSPSWSGTIADLVQRDGLYYKKFTDVPFTGKVTGNQQGSVKNGKEEGAWAYYFSDGHLSAKGNYKSGELEGPWVWYNKDGTVDKKSGNYKGSKKISD